MNIVKNDKLYHILKLTDELTAASVRVETVLGRYPQDPDGLVVSEAEIVLPDDATPQELTSVDTVCANHTPTYTPPKTPEQQLRDDLAAATSWQQVRDALIAWLDRKAGQGA